MTNPFQFSDKVYGFLKWFALITLPAITSSYFALGQIWGWSNVTEVVGTLTIIDTLIGTMIGISTKSYNNSEDRFDGTLHTSIDDVAGVKLYTLELNSDPETLDNKSSIVFKVDVSD